MEQADRQQQKESLKKKGLDEVPGSYDLYRCSIYRPQYNKLSTHA